MTRIRSRRRQKVCAQCGQGFQASRRDAKFCSDACRKAASRDRVAVSADIPRTEPVKPRSQLQHNLATAEAWLEWKRQYEGPEL